MESLKYVWESVIVATFPRSETWRGTKRNVNCLLYCQSYGLVGRPWPFKAAKVPRPLAVSQKVWLRETKQHAKQTTHKTPASWRQLSHSQEKCTNILNSQFLLLLIMNVFCVFNSISYKALSSKPYYIMSHFHTSFSLSSRALTV